MYWYWVAKNLFCWKAVSLQLLSTELVLVPNLIGMGFYQEQPVESHNSLTGDLPRLFYQLRTIPMKTNSIMSIWTTVTEVSPANTLIHNFLHKESPCYAPMLTFCSWCPLIFLRLGNWQDCLVMTVKLLLVNHCFLFYFKLFWLDDFLRAKLSQMSTPGIKYIMSISFLFPLLCPEALSKISAL